MPASIFVRADGEADVALQSPSNSLLYFTATPGNPWSSFEVAGAGTTLSQPSIFVRADGEADITAQGPNESLLYYHAVPGGPWVSDQVAGAGTTFGDPSIIVRADGEADIVAPGPDNSLLYYRAVPGGPWVSDQVAGAGTTFGDPSIFVRADGEADIVAQGPNNSLLYYSALPGGAWNRAEVAGAGTTFGDPSIFVRADGEADIVAPGPNQSLLYYWMPARPQPVIGEAGIAAPGAGPEVAVPWNSVEVAGTGTSAAWRPSIFVRPDGEADIVAVSPTQSLMYYWAKPGGAWQNSAVADPWTTIPVAAPSIFVRADGEADIVVLLDHWTPMYYLAVPGGEWNSAQLARMYEFAIPRLNIVTLRSGIAGFKLGATDTDYASLSVQVNGQQAQTVTASLGNLGDGNVNVNLSASVVAADADLVTLTYTVINSSNGPAAAIAFLEQAASKILNAVVKADEAAIQAVAHVPLSELSSQEASALVGAQLGFFIAPGFGAIIGGIVGWFAANIPDYLWPDCDGPVASGLHVWSGAQVRALATANGGAGTTGEDDNQGVPTPKGCGDNSDYQVYWSIIA